VPNSTDIAKHAKEIYAKIVVLISAIIKIMVKSEACITDTMENDLKNFEDMISNREFLMEKTYFGFELHRINFDIWGRFKGVTKPVRQMCLLGYWLVRLFIFEILMKPWEIGICKDSRPCRFTARIFCSILIYGIEDYVKNRVKLQPENMFNLDLKNRTKAKEPMKIDDQVKPEKKKGSKPIGAAKMGESVPVFADVIEKKDLAAFFTAYGDVLQGLLENMVRTFYERIFSEVFEGNKSRSGQGQGSNRFAV
jgi:hypothetical protein